MNSLILLVDDSPVVRAAAAEALRRAGYGVVTADGGNDALCRLAEKPPPDLMLLDMVLPGGPDGMEVLRRLGPSAPPVIVMTGDGSRLQDFQGTKVKRVLSKPHFTVEDMVAAVAGVLAEHPPAPDPRQPADPPAGGCP